MGFSRPEYWSGLPLHSPWYLPNPGIKTKCLASPALAGGFFTTTATLEVPSNPLSSVQFSFSVMSDPATLWTVARQAPPSMGFSRQEYWSGLPLSSPGDLPNPGIKPKYPESPALRVDSLLLNHQGRPVQCWNKHRSLRAKETRV